MKTLLAAVSLLFLSAWGAFALEIEVKVGTAVVNRDVVGQASVFPASIAQLAGWSRIKGATEPIEVYHRWRLNGKDESLVELKIRSSFFRAWSYLEPKGKKGTWTLDVLDWEKNILASTSFETR